MGGPAMQLEFLWRDQSSFHAELEARLGAPIEITFTDNSSSIMSFKSARGDKPARLRIHRMFLAAEPTVVSALCTWLKRRCNGRSAEVLDGFIRQNGHLIRPRERRNPPRLTQGNVYDLDALYDTVNREHFNNAVDTDITWGRMPPSRRRWTIRLGSYTPEDNLIRVHPLLDQDFVPEYFVKYIVFHEMLHAHLDVEHSPSGRRRIHTAEFNRRERAYPDYARAVAWNDDPENMRRLLRG